MCRTLMMLPFPLVVAGVSLCIIKEVLRVFSGGNTELRRFSLPASRIEEDGQNDQPLDVICGKYPENNDKAQNSGE